MRHYPLRGLVQLPPGEIRLFEQGLVRSGRYLGRAPAETRPASSPGADAPPVVTPTAVRIENGYVEVEIHNYTRQATTIPACSPVALLDSEYYIRGCVDE